MHVAFAVLRCLPDTGKQDRKLYQSSSVATPLKLISDIIGWQEEQKGKKKKNTKKKLSPNNTNKLPPEGSSPETKLESHSSSLADHEYTAGASTFGVAQVNRGSQPMAPGVFLTQRRPSSSSQNNAAAKGNMHTFMLEMAEISLINNIFC